MDKAKFYKISSKTTKGKKYIVRLFPSGELRCGCPKFIFTGSCHHLTKRCSKCGITKRIDEFYRHYEGVQSWCKECQNKRHRENKSYRDKKQKRQLVYRKSKEFKKWNKQYSKKYRKSKEVRMKTRANSIVNYEIKVGRLKKQPCEICGNQIAEAHHDDYSKPLEVRWLCFKHHRKLENRWVDGDHHSRRKK